MHYCDTAFKCPHPGCDGDSFYAECKGYDGTHKNEDREYAWANVAEHNRHGISVIEPDGTISSPHGYRSPPDRWTTKAQRDADPDLARRVEETQCRPCIYVSDPTWYKCSKCQQDIDAEWARSLIPPWPVGPDGKPVMPIIYKEIGMVVINDYGVSRIEVE